MSCSTQDCEKPAWSRGLCQACYTRLRRNGSVARKNVVNTGACTEPGCGRLSFAKNLCAMHYQRAQHPLQMVWRLLRPRAPGAYPPAWDRFEAFLADVGERPGPKHQLRRPNPLAPWSTTNMVWREPIGGSTLDPEGAARYAWLWHIRNKYGLSEARLIALYESQGGACPICQRDLKRLHPETGIPVKVCIDHDHLTGRVRGIICDAENKALGQFEDSVDRLRAAIAYLETDPLLDVAAEQPE